MDIVIDASAILAVLLNEPEREAVVESTIGESLIAPSSIVYEIGNALSALMRRRSLTIADSIAAYHAFSKIPIRLIEPEIPSALLISGEEKIYAYDAYFITCAERMALPLLTLDQRLANTARKRGVSVLET